MGWCREGSDLTTQRIRLFPDREATYMENRGMESQVYTASRPGRPVRKKEVPLLLESDMTTWMNRTPSRCVFTGPTIKRVAVSEPVL